MAEKAGYKHFMLKEIFEQPMGRSRRPSSAAPRSRPARSSCSEIEIPDEVLREDRARRDPRLRHVVALGAGRQVPDRVAGARAGRRRLRLRVSLPRPDRLEEHARGRDHAVRRDRRHAGGAARGEEEGGAQHRDLQRRRQHGDARDRRDGLHARRAGDRRRVDQGVHLAAGRAAPAGALPRPDPRHAVAGRGPAAPRSADAAAAAARAGAQVRAADRGDRASASTSAATSSISGAGSTIRSRSKAR